MVRLFSFSSIRLSTLLSQHGNPYQETSKNWPGVRITSDPEYDGYPDLREEFPYRLSCADTLKTRDWQYFNQGTRQTAVTYKPYESSTCHHPHLLKLKEYWQQLGLLMYVTGHRFLYWRYHEIPRYMCLLDVVANGLRIPFTDTGVRLTKLPSTVTMFGAYQPYLSNTN